MQETWEDPLEKELATHSSTVAWEIPWTEEPGGLQSMGSLESDMTYQLNNNKSTKYPNHYAVHLKLTRYMSITSQKTKESNQISDPLPFPDPTLTTVNTE